MAKRKRAAFKVASDAILGRALNCKAFCSGEPFRVSVYRTRWKSIRYSDPVQSRPKNSVLYRIIVKQKKWSKI